MKRMLSLLLALVTVFALAACGGNETPETTLAPVSTSAPETTAPSESSNDGKLVSTGMMDIQYAQQFTVETFEGGYRLVHELTSDSRILVVPEGMSVPTDLEENVQVLQLPVTKSYVCGSNMVAMTDAIGCIDQVTLVGVDTTWHFQSIKDQLDSGYTQFAGGYTTDPDYEMIATHGTQLVIWNGYEEDVFQKFHDLGIVVLCEENTTEPGVYGRLEWLKLLGVLYGIEDQANAYYDDQVAQINEIQSYGDTGVVVGIGGISSSGKFYSRKSGDFQADYVRYANGTYNLEDVEQDSAGSLTMTPEDFYLRFKDCDVLIWNFSATGNLETLVETYPAIEDFKAYQTGRLYIQSGNFIQSAANPACIIRDIYTVITSTDPDVTTDHIQKMPATPSGD